MRRRLFFLIGLVVLLICPAGIGQVSAGVADLRHWTLEQRAVLDGDWEFYWQQRVPPGVKPDTAPEYARVGVPWESRLKKLMPIYGQATYRLKVLLPESAVNLPLMLRTQFVASRFKCYANGELMGQNGLSVDPKLDADSYTNTL